MCDLSSPSPLLSLHSLPLLGLSLSPTRSAAGGGVTTGLGCCQVAVVSPSRFLWRLLSGMCACVCVSGGGVCEGMRTSVCVCLRERESECV